MESDAIICPLCRGVSNEDELIPNEETRYIYQFFQPQIEAYIKENEPGEESTDEMAHEEVDITEEPMDDEEFDDSFVEYESSDLIDSSSDMESDQPHPVQEVYEVLQDYPDLLHYFMGEFEHFLSQFGEYPGQIAEFNGQSEAFAQQLQEWLPAQLQALLPDHQLRELFSQEFQEAFF